MFNIFLYFITLSIMLYTHTHLHVNILAYLFSSMTAKPSYLPKEKKKPTETN